MDKPAKPDVELCQTAIYVLGTELIEAGGDFHDEECPQDDTCECELVGLINRAMEGWNGPGW